MKKVAKITFYSILAIIGMAITLWFFVGLYYSPSRLYGMREEERYRTINTYKSLSTDDLIQILDKNKDWNKMRGRNKDIQYVHYEEAIRALSSRTDKKALKKVEEIIYNYPEGQKGTAAVAIGESKNKAIVPVLCTALKRHTDSHTDYLIVSALYEVDDPSALDCLANEKSKLKLSYAVEKAEKAIEKWRKKK